MQAPADKPPRGDDKPPRVRPEAAERVAQPSRGVPPYSTRVLPPDGRLCGVGAKLQLPLNNLTQNVLYPFR